MSGALGLLVYSCVDLVLRFVVFACYKFIMISSGVILCVCVVGCVSGV